MIEIKNRFSGAVIFSSDEAKTLLEAVKAAIASRADLSRANLSRAYLSCADLSGAYLSCADLSGADLFGADLSGADLFGADLSGANLSGADLSGANLSGAYLSGANLSGADLSGADLSRADLFGANLSGANLSCADLSGAKNVEKMILQHQIVPQEGAFIAFKKLSDNSICKLMIPAEAKRIGGLVGRKCRAEFAIVIEGDGFSNHDKTFAYKKGETVRPKKPFTESQEECASGIHFFLSREEAEDYKF